MPVFTSTGNEFMVPLDYHQEMCALAEGRIQTATRPFNVDMALQETADPAGFSVRYLAGQYMVNLFHTPKDLSEEAGPSDNIALLKIETAQALPVTDRWPNAYVHEIFTAGLVHPRFQHFKQTLWKYDLEIEHRRSSGMLSTGPDAEAVFREHVDLKAILSQEDWDKIVADIRKVIFDPDPELDFDRISLAELNEAYELFPDIMQEYHHRKTIERLIGAQALLNAPDLVEIGCEPSPFVRES